MFTRVFQSILDSSLNVQSIPPSTRWLWITMLLVGDADRTGVVDMPVERLAARAGLTVDETEAGLRVLGSPDPDSSSDEAGGARIVPLRPDSTRGWRLVNWGKYRDIATTEQRREQTRVRVARYRDRQDAVEEPVTGTDLPAEGLGAVEIILRTLRLVAPLTALDEIEVALWLRDINPDPWWIAAAICEASGALGEQKRAPRYVRAILKRYAEEQKVFEDAMGYVQYMTSPERAAKLQ